MTFAIRLHTTVMNYNNVDKSILAATYKTHLNYKLDIPIAAFQGVKLDSVKSIQHMGSVLTEEGRCRANESVNAIQGISNIEIR